MHASPDHPRPRVAIVGLGTWGPNIARNLAVMDSCELAWACDANPEARERLASALAPARMTDELDEVLADQTLDAVCVATPVPTHAEVARRVLEAGKHCFVEKPLALTPEDAESVATLASDRGLVLMVGHLLEYHPGVEMLRELVSGGDLGEARYIYSQRLNLGQLRADENVLWSLGAHDVSVVLALARGEAPVEVQARGQSYVRDGVEDVAFCYLHFASGLVAHLHLSWLDPHKSRRFTVVGSRKMATFDDMELERKLTVYDKGFDPDHDSYGEYITRTGDIYSPRVPNTEPLRLECAHFVECVATSRPARTDGAAGVRVVRVLDALQRSLEAGGVTQHPVAVA